MSTQTEITRIQTARNTIRTKLVSLGLATATSKIDALATAVEGIENKGAVTSLLKEGEIYIIPKGYHNGSGSVTGVAGGGNYSLQVKEGITPTKSQQNVTPDSGYYGLSAVTVDPIPDNYHDTDPVTATAADVLATKVIVNGAGEVITGDMRNNGAVSKTLTTASVEATSFTIPAGYHNGSGKVSITTETKTATPTNAAQDITPTSGKVLSKVTVEPIPAPYHDVSKVTATAADVLKNTKFVDAGGNLVEGGMTNNGKYIKTLTTEADGYAIGIPEGYHNGEGYVLVNVVENAPQVYPTEETQFIRGANGTFLKEVIVNKIPRKYKDISGVTATADDVLKPASFIDSSGATVEGTMPNNGAVALTIDGLTTTSIAVPTGYHNGSGTVSLTNDIETALAAI